MSFVGDFIGDITGTNKAAKRAANATRQAAEQSAAVQREALAQSKELLGPFQQAGAGVLNRLGHQAGRVAPGISQGLESLRNLQIPGLNGPIELDAAAQYRLNQAKENTQQALAARGIFNSGTGVRAEQEAQDAVLSSELDRNRARALEQYGLQEGRLGNLINLENNLNQQGFGQLLNLATLGANAAAGQSTGQLQTGANLANIYTGQGNQLAGIYQQQGAQNAANFGGLLGLGLTAFGGLGGLGGGGGGGGVSTGTVPFNPIPQPGGQVPLWGP